MEEAILYKVLKEISKGGSGNNAAPTTGYLNALQEIGLIDQSWDTKLTNFGHSMLDHLRNKIEKW